VAEVTSALAVAFDWESAGAGLDFDVVVPSGGVIYGGTIDSGRYRVLLGTGGAAGGTSEPLADFLQVAEGAINAAIAATGRTATLTMGADGRVAVALNSGTFDLPGGAVAAILGFTATMTGAGAYTAPHAPKHLALMVSRYGGKRAVRTPGAWATDDAGFSYGVGSGVTTRRYGPTVDFVPRTPSVAAAVGTAATATEPDETGGLATLGDHAAPWTWDDVFATAGGQVCALAEGNFQALRAGTGGGATFALVTVDGAFLAAHEYEPRDPAWPVYYRFELPLTRLASPTYAARS
jgi:hypothetical protein